MALHLFRRVAGGVVCAFLAVSSPARATVIPAYFGWNYVTDSLGLAAPAGMELTSFTYIGGAGAGLVMNIPAFPGRVGLPDGIGIANLPTFTTVAGGDGETTRNNPLPQGRLLPIDWVPPNTPAPFLLAPVPFPTIGITSFTTSLFGGAAFGNYSGFPPNPAGQPDYVVGLILNAADPPAPNEELNSALVPPQGDIYGAVNGTLGNPTLGATNALGLGDLNTVIFAAAVPEPATWVLLVIPVALLLGRRRGSRGHLFEEAPSSTR